jgi:hypothetical protein
MMITNKNKQLKANHLDFFNVRQLKHLPRHFESINLPMKYNLETSLSKWIKDNLRGRYYVGKTVNLDRNNQLATLVCIAFEQPKELSYFTLACPLLKYK